MHVNSWFTANLEPSIAIGPEQMRPTGGELTPGGYGCKLMQKAGDGEPDTFRIRTWYEVNDTETVVYDNGINQETDGGSIVIHTK